MANKNRQRPGAERGASGSGARVNMRITSKEFAALAADAVEPGDEFFHHYYNLDSVKLKRYNGLLRCRYSGHGQ